MTDHPTRTSKFLSYVLRVDAPALHEAGHALYRSTDTVWLTRRVPPSFLTLPSS